jgi:hypothetical protein
MDKVIKYFKGKVKSVDSVKKTATVVISDETKDRYDERVLVSSFKSMKKSFMKHPVLLSSHMYHGLQNQIGKFLKLSIDEDAKEVVGEIEYFVGLGNPEADWAWVLAEKGIAAFSIGFIPKIWKSYSEEERNKNGGVWRDYEEIELLETSQVLIPANPSALQKGFGDNEADNLFLKELQDILQSEDNIREDGITWEEKKEVEEKEIPKEEGTMLAAIKEMKDMISSRLDAIDKEIAELKGLVETYEHEFDMFQESFEAFTLKMIPKEVVPETTVEQTVTVPETEKEIEIPEEVMGEEKLAELKSVLFGAQISEEDQIMSIFKEMNEEIKKSLSVQS